MNNSVYFNGEFISQEKATVPITTHALHYGTGCFEGIRAYYSEKDQSLYIFRQKEHYERLRKSCKTLYISMPYSVDKLCEITIELVKRNKIPQDLYIRPLAYKADLAIGNFNLQKLKDGFFIYTTPLGRHFQKEGIRTHISSWVRVPSKAIPPAAKITGLYANTTLAKTESADKGYDEALFLDIHGNIVEGSAENIFAIINDTVVTPPTTDDILEGITRNTIITLCKNELGLKVEERSIKKEEIFSASEVFLTGTGAEISPVIEIDDKKIGKGGIGSISRDVKDLYNKLVHGQYKKYPEFLTKVSL